MDFTCLFEKRFETNFSINPRVQYNIFFFFEVKLPYKMFVSLNLFHF